MEHISKYAEAEMKRIKDAAQANESLERGKALRHTPLVVPSKAQGEDFICEPSEKGEDVNVQAYANDS